MKKILIISVVTITCLVFLTEIFLRLFCYQKLREQHIPLIYVPDSLCGYRYLRNISEFTSNPAFYNGFVLNNQGFTGPDFNVNKTKNKFRIVIVAASDGTGIWTNGEKNYSIFLQEYLNKVSDNIEVINCSIDGEDRAMQSINLIRNFCKKISPDLILLRVKIPITYTMLYRTCYKGYCINYYDYHGNLDDAKKYIDDKLTKRNPFNIIYNASFIFRYLCKYYIENNNSITAALEKWLLTDRVKVTAYIKKKVHNNFSDEIPDQKYYTTQESLDTLIFLRNELNNAGINLILYNTYSDPNQELISYILKLVSLEYLPLNVPKRNFYDFGEKDMHSSQEGHKVIAEKLFKDLIMHNLIPDTLLKEKIKDSLLLHSAQKNKTPKKAALVYFTNYHEIKDINKKYNVSIFYPSWFDEVKNLSYNSFDSSYLGNNKIKVITHGIFTNTSVNNYILNFDSLSSKDNADLVIVPMPALDDIENNIHTIKLMSLRYLREKRHLCFYNFGNTEKEEILVELLKLNNADCFNLDINLQDCIDLNSSSCKEFLNQYTNLISRKIYYKFLLSGQIIDDYLNLSYRKEVDVSSSFEAWGWSKNNLVDGEITSSEKNKGWTSWNKKEDKYHYEWIILNLGTVCNIDKICLFPRSDKLAGSGFPENIDIYSSKDSLNWIKIDIDKINREDYEQQIIEFPVQSAKYVKITGNNFKSGRSGYMMTFSEIEIYGKP